MRSTTWWSVSFKLRADRPNPAYTVRVSRLFWMGVGAAGGIVVYRKGTNAVNGVRERTFRENLSRVAQGASSVAASARYLANVVSDEPDGNVVDIRKVARSDRPKAPAAPDIRPATLGTLHDRRAPGTARE